MRRVTIAGLLAVAVAVIAGIVWAGDGDDARLLTGCQRIDEPGKYRLTSDLNDAPVTLSVDAALADVYTGTRALTRACFEIAASGVELDCQGHRLVGGDTEGESASIVVSGTSDVPLSDVNVDNCAVSGHQFGIHAANVRDARLADNEVTRNGGTGVYVAESSGVAIMGNLVEGNDPDGILVLSSEGVTVSDNVARYNRMRGITLDHRCSDCIVRGNESHHHGVLGFAIYDVTGTAVEGNVAHDNRYHGFAILHGGGGATFRDNESYANDATGFYVESQDNHYTGNDSHDNGRDGMILLRGASAGSSGNNFDGNTFRDNGQFGMFADEPIDSAVSAGNTFSSNVDGPSGSRPLSSADVCFYTGFGRIGECDPVFLGGPNLKDPVALDPVIDGVALAGDPRYVPSMGDLWMSTWTEDDRLVLTWGDGIGFSEGYPTTHPEHLSPDPADMPPCKPDPYRQDDPFEPGRPEYFPHGLWCNVFRNAATDQQPRAPLTDAGVGVADGPVPDLDRFENLAIDAPSGDPTFVTGPDGLVASIGRNDKPSSILQAGGRLYLAGHAPAGSPTEGYVAWSDDGGRTWTEAPGSPWGATSNFRVLMFINRGQGHQFHRDGHVYALGIGAEAYWPARSVHLARVPVDAITDYDAYEYYSGLDGADPQWSAVESDAVPLEGLHTIEQASAMFHLGTGRYLMLTSNAKDDPDHDGALFEAPQPWGPWAKAADLCFDPVCAEADDNPLWTDIKYIAGLIPKGAGPNHVHFTIAGGDDHYQLQIGRLTLATE